MADSNNKFPDLKEITAMAGKFFQDLKKSVTDIINDFKNNQDKTTEKSAPEKETTQKSESKSASKAAAPKKETAKKEPAKAKVTSTAKKPKKAE